MVIGSCGGSTRFNSEVHPTWVLCSKVSAQGNMTTLWLHWIVFIQLPFNPHSPTPSVHILFSINILTPSYSNIFLVGELVYFGSFSSYLRVIMVTGLIWFVGQSCPVSCTLSLYFPFWTFFSENFVQHFILGNYIPSDTQKFQINH